MDREQTDALILKKLDDLAEGQSVMNGEIKSLITKNEEQDKRHCEQMDYIRKDIEKGVEGRRVLHEKQDAIEKEVKALNPDILFVKAVRNNVNKIVGWAVLVIIIGILLTSLPKIIEVIK